MKLTRLHTGPRYHHYQRRVIKVKWIRPQDGLPELKNTNERYLCMYKDKCFTDWTADDFLAAYDDGYEFNEDKIRKLAWGDIG